MVADPPVVLALSATLVGETVQVRPIEGDTVLDSEIVPVNPWRPVSAIVDVPDAPAKRVTVVGLADRVKSWTV
jgi:hypothetical protein